MNTDLNQSNFISLIGRKILRSSEICGEVVILVKRTFYWFFHAPLNRRNVFLQLLEMGARTFPVTSLTLFFTGMVLALQSGYSFIKVFNEPLYVGRLVGASICKELGPVLTSLVFAGRVGAAVAAELGTMKVTEQIDALYTLGTNPIKYLAVPPKVNLPPLYIFIYAPDELMFKIVEPFNIKFPES